MAKQIDLRARCAKCGHSFSFHGNARYVTCGAMGCKGGAKGKRCPGFVGSRAVSVPAQVPIAS